MASSSNTDTLLFIALAAVGFYLYSKHTGTAPPLVPGSDGWGPGTITPPPGGVQPPITGDVFAAQSGYKFPTLPPSSNGSGS